MSFRILEIGLVGGALAVLAGYHLYFLRELTRAPGRTIIGLARDRRRLWVESIVARGDGILAVQTLRNWIMTASFLASTAIIISAGLLGFLVSSEEVSDLIHRINLLGDQSDALITVKMLLLVANFFAAFFSFSLSLRYYNYLALTINAAGEGDRERVVDLSVDYLARGAAHYTIGMRGYYLAIPLALWLFGPVWLLVGSVVLTIALYRHDHATAYSQGPG